MTEHLRLKRICDEIGFKLPTTNFYGNGEVFDFNDVREIIFTPEFMEKYNLYDLKDVFYGNNAYTIPKNSRMGEILNYLDDPVTYLYDLLFNE